MRATLLAATGTAAVWSVHAEMAPGAAARRCLRRGADDRARASGLAPSPRPAAQQRPRQTDASPGPTPSARPEPTERDPVPKERADPRWRFFTDDTARHTSPWFAGSHRVMIGYGCTPAPYYDHDPAAPATRASTTASTWRCRAGHRCSPPSAAWCWTRRRAARPGSAYGERPFRIRTGDRDVLVGHARRVFVAAR